jgi:hypothetical protein
VERAVGGGSECVRSGECDSRRKDQINVCPIARAELQVGPVDMAHLRFKKKSPF